jgi:regulator of sigma E protease
MKMGGVVTVSDYRPVCAKELQPGDVIRAVNGDANFDPVRLPDLVHELVGQGKAVTLQVARGASTFDLKVDPRALEGRGTWIEERPGFASPMGFPALGFSYKVEPEVVAVAPGSPAEKAGLKAGDTIKVVVSEREGKKDTMELGEKFSWPYIFDTLQEAPPGDTYTCTVLGSDGQERTTTPMKPVPDPTWYRATRGLPLEAETRLHIADGAWDAILIGARESYRFVGRIYLNLYSLVRGDISYKLVNGPIKLAEMTYLIAYQGFIDLLHFLAIISINLAIVNFLPIPVLDGGHMVLLLAEKIRGRPLNDTWIVIVSYIGLAIVATLMLSTIFLDISKFAWFRNLFGW